MLEIRIGGKPLVLSAGTGVELELVNTLLATDLQDSFSLPFKVPVAGNEKLLGFVHLFQLASRTKAWPNAELLVDGVPRQIGEVYFEGFEGERNIYLSFNADGFFTAAKKLALRDIAYDLIVLGTEDLMLEHAATVAAQTWPVASHCFPMFYNPIFYGERNPDFFPASESEYDAAKTYAAGDFITYTFADPEVMRTRRYQSLAGSNTGNSPTSGAPWWRETAFGLINHWDHVEEEYFRNVDDDNFYALVPFFYLKWILTRALEAMGWTPNGPFMDDAFTHRVALYNNTALDSNGRSHYVSAGQITPLHFDAGDPARVICEDDSTAPEFQDPESIWDTSLGTYEVEAAGRYYYHVSGTIVFGQADLPRLYLRRADTDAIVATVTLANPGELITPQTTWNISMLINHVHLASDINDLFYIGIDGEYHQGTNAIDTSGFKVRIYLVNPDENNYFSDQIDPRDHMPDMTVGELLLELRDNFNLDFHPDAVNKTVRFSFRQNDLLAAPKDATPRLRSAIAADNQAPPSGFRFVSDIDGPALPDLTKFNVLPEVDTEADVPTPLAPNDLITVRNTRKVLLSYQKGGAFAWRFAGYNYPTFTLGDADTAEEVSPALLPMMLDLKDSQGVDFMVPVIEDEGNSYRFLGNGYVAPKLRMVNYEGLVTRGAANYPFATSTYYGYDGATNDVAYALGLTEDVVASPSLIWRYWQKWADRISRAEPIIVDLEVDANWVLSGAWRKPMLLHHQVCVVVTMPITYDSVQGATIARGVRMLKLPLD